MINLLFTLLFEYYSVKYNRMKVIHSLTEVCYNRDMAQAKKPKDTRKIKYTAQQLKEILAELNLYVDSKDFPTLAEFITVPEIQHKYRLTHQYVYDHPEIFEHPLSVMTNKGEAFLVKQGLAGRAMPMTIFLLKQMKYGGYSDSQQIDLTSKSQPIKFVNNVPRPKKLKK